MTIIARNKVIDMANYPKDEESSFKNEKNMSISFFEEIFEFTKNKLGLSWAKLSTAGAG